MFLLQLLPLVLAAEWYRGDRFNQFVQGVNNAKHQDDTPLSTWLVPSWMQHLQAIDIPKVRLPLDSAGDADFNNCIQFLRKAKIPVRSWLYDRDMNTLAEKIVATLNQSESDEWTAGLKEYARRLVENVKMFPRWLEENRCPANHHLRIATLMGFHWSKVSDEVDLVRARRIIEGELPYENMPPKLQMFYAADYASLLNALPRATGCEFPAADYLAERLNQISATNSLEAPSLHSLLNMVPIGQRVAIGAVSQLDSAAIVDLIKATDGNTYGILYASGNALALCIPTINLANLVEFLHKPSCDMISNGMEVIKCQAVKLPWHPLGPLRNALTLVRHYAIGGAATVGYNHLAMATLLLYCEGLTGIMRAQSLPAQQESMLQLARNLSPINAQMLHNALIRLQSVHPAVTEIISSLYLG